MSLTDVITILAMFLGGALLYRYRYRVFAPFRRFEARNAARRAEEARALFDRYAHYHQTLQLTEEQVEQVTKIRVPDERTGQPVDRYLFLGVQYATRQEAEAVRHAQVIAMAREFYIDLDTNWLPRRGRQESLAAALPNPARPSPSKPPRP